MPETSENEAVGYAVDFYEEVLDEVGIDAGRW